MDDNNQNMNENQTDNSKTANFEPLSADDLIQSDNKNKFYIVGAGILIFVLIFVLVFKFFTGKSKTNKEVKLTYWGLWEEKEVIQPLIDQYQNKNPNIKIEYIKRDPQDYRNKLIVRSQQGQGPDIYRFHNTWIPEIKEVLSYIPNSVLSNKEFEKTFYPIFKTDLKIGDHYYGIPLMIDGLVLLYNENLFKSAGIDKPPHTWEDVINNISKLTVRDKEGKLVTAGIAIGTASNIEHFSDILGLFIIQNGGDLKNLDSQEAEGALESYRKFAEPPDNYWDESMPNAIAAFTQEKVAMILVPSWQILSIKSINPELVFKAVPVPSLPGSEPISISSYWVEGVSRFSNKQEDAWRFLKFLSEKENMAKIYELQTKSRQFPTASSRVDLASIQSQNQYLDAVIKQAKYYKSIPSVSLTYDNGLNDGVNQYLENAINSTINGESYKSALKTAKEGIEQELKRYD